MSTARHSSVRKLSNPSYTTSSDSTGTIVTDLISKCSSNQDLTVDYKLNLDLKVIGVTVHPSLSSSASFACPVDGSQIEKIIGSSI